MPKNYLQGIKTKIFFAILSAEDLAKTTLTAPVDSPITTTAIVSSGAISVPVTALTFPVPAGSAITLTAGAQKLVVYTTASSPTGATSLPILAVPASFTTPLATPAAGTYTALLQLRGGTGSQEQIQNADTVIRNYQDPGAGGTGVTFDDGIITSASWELSYSFSVLSDDLGTYRLRYCAANAVNGVRGYVRRQLAAPPGYSTGDAIEGLVDVTTTSRDAPSDNVVSSQCTFKGRGAPIITPAAI